MSCQEEAKRDLVTGQKEMVALNETIKIKITYSSEVNELEQVEECQNLKPVSRKL